MMAICVEGPEKAVKFVKTLEKTKTQGKTGCLTICNDLGVDNVE